MGKHIPDNKPFVDWSKAPEGTTHVFASPNSYFINGVPEMSSSWEKWVPNFDEEQGLEGYTIYEFMNNKWEEYCSFYIPPKNVMRIAKPINF